MTSVSLKYKHLSHILWCNAVFFRDGEARVAAVWLTFTPLLSHALSWQFGPRLLSEALLGWLLPGGHRPRRLPRPLRVAAAVPAAPGRRVVACPAQPGRAQNGVITRGSDFKNSNSSLCSKDQNSSFHVIPNTKVNGGHLSFAVIHRCGVNQPGCRFGVLGEGGEGVLTQGGCGWAGGFGSAGAGAGAGWEFVPRKGHSQIQTSPCVSGEGTAGQVWVPPAL